MTGTLKANEVHPWKKNTFSTLTFAWSGTAGTGQVSVTIDGTAASYKVPQNALALAKKAGKIVNNTDKTITYTLTS